MKDNQDQPKEVEKQREPIQYQIVWRSGEDWWSGEEIENGVMPSDARPYVLINGEWQELT